MLDITENAANLNASGTLYEATINNETLAIYNRHTGEELEAVAVIPTHAPDLVALVNKVPVQLASELARMAAWRALGRETPPPQDFHV